jgi:hypothetical protein
MLQAGVIIMPGVEVAIDVDSIRHWDLVNGIAKSN